MPSPDATPAVAPVTAATPPMGWNSWDSYGTTVTEPEVLANASFMAEHLLPVGWDTVVVDIAWYDPTARSHGYNVGAPVVLDAVGRQQPDPVRFPSAAGGQGFGPLAARLHEQGLRFGLHLVRGIPRRAVELDLPVEGTPWTARDVAVTSDVCTWNPDCFGVDHDHPGAQAYYDSQLRLLAGWGVDLLKIDDIAAPYRTRDVEAYALAAERCGRPMVLSLSPGTHLSVEHLDHLREHAHMWRVSDDLWDRWEDVHAQLTRMARWAPLQRPGGWADADMLPLGRIGIRAERGEDRQSRLTLDEQRTMLTLWVMARSPLMVGGDLPTSDPATLDLLRNPAVGRVLREGRGGREVLREPLDDGELVIWTAGHASAPAGAQGATGTHDAAHADDAAGPDDAAEVRHVAVFWTGPAARRPTVPWGTVGWHHPPGSTGVSDHWTGERLPVAPTGLELHVPAHGVRWLELRRAAHHDLHV